MEAARFSYTPVKCLQMIRRRVPEINTFHRYSRENLKLDNFHHLLSAVQDNRHTSRPDASQADAEL
jgi:hypothetical protein